MSRVFEALTAAVCEKNDPGKRKLRGSAAEDDRLQEFIARYETNAYRWKARHH